MINLHGAPLLDVRELRILGTHQYANALAVALACSAMGLSAETIAAVGQGKFLTEIEVRAPSEEREPMPVTRSRR